MLEFDRVTYSTGGNVLLDDLSFRVAPGEVVAVIGGSGAGKSTLFKLLSGEIKPSTGEIYLDSLGIGDLSFNGTQQYRRQIGVVFQDFRLLPQKTVFENISFSLEVCGVPSKSIAPRVFNALELVGLWTKQRAFPRELSGGEQQRVAIARALIHDPKILIADEPTGNLDPKNARQISELVADINKKRRLTVLLATHDPNLLSHLRPRVLRLKEGRLEFDLYDCSPADAFRGLI